VLVFTMGGTDGPSEKQGSCMGPPMYHATLGIPKALHVLAEAGCACRHLEYDQHPELHVYIVAQKLAKDDPATGDPIRLRDVERDDLPRMYEMQLDPESNRLAVTIPRGAEAFEAHWANVLRDPSVTAKAILLGERMVGTVSCFQRDGQAYVGYWVSREHWGKGVASRALELLLLEVPDRPLYARVPTGNGASLRVLQKCGFVVERVQVLPATDRHPECEVALLVLPGKGRADGMAEKETPR
jgi:RimJ/RimL family protein N-acetyltransferase